VFSVGSIQEGEDTERVALSWTDREAYYRVNEPVQAWEKPGCGGAAGRAPEVPAGKERTEAVFFFENGILTGACAVGGLHALAVIRDAVAAAPDREKFWKMAAEGGLTA